MVRNTVKANYPACAVAVFVLIGATLRLISVFTKSLAADELRTVISFVPKPVWNILFDPYYPNNSILNTLLIKASTSVFGDSAMAIRMPALLMSIASVGALFVLAKRVLGTWQHAMLCSLFLSLSWWHVLYSTSCRAYSSIVLFTILSAYFLDKTVCTGSIRAAAGFVISTFLCVLSHLWTLVLFPAWGAMVLISGGLRLATRRTKQAATWRGIVITSLSVAIAAAAVLAVYHPSLPIVKHVYNRITHGSFDYKYFDGAEATEFPSVSLVLTWLSGCSGIGVWFCVAVGVAGLITIAVCKPRAAGLCASTLGVVPLVMWVAGIHPWPRYLIVLLPFYLLAVSAGVVVLAEAPSRVLRTHIRIPTQKVKTLLTMLLACVIGGMMLPMAWHHARRACFGDLGGNWAVKPAAEYLARNASPGDLVLAYPLDRKRAADTWFDRQMPWNLQYYMAKLVWPNFDAPLPADNVGVWYLTPRKKLAERSELPSTYEPSLVAQFENVYIYHDDMVLTKGLREIPIPPETLTDGGNGDEPWTITPSYGKAEVVVMAADEAPSSSKVWSFKIMRNGTKFIVLSPRIPAVPRRLTELCGYVQGDLGHCTISLRFLDDAGNVLRSVTCTLGWQEPEWIHLYAPEDPPGSGWHRYRLATVVPSRARTMQIGLHVRDYWMRHGTSKGQEFKFRLGTLRADW